MLAAYVYVMLAGVPQAVHNINWKKAVALACIALCLVGVGVLAGYFAGDAHGRNKANGPPTATTSGQQHSLVWEEWSYNVSNCEVSHLCRQRCSGQLCNQQSVRVSCLLRGRCCLGAQQVQPCHTVWPSCWRLHWAEAVLWP